MITKLKEWFESLESEEEIDKSNQILHISFAVVVFHVVRADGKETLQEQEKFVNIFTEYFDLDKERVAELYKFAVNLEGNVDEHLEVLKEKIAHVPSVKMKLMHEVNSLIQADGIDNREYVVFEKIREALS